MSGLIRINRKANFFERTIDDIVDNHFFSSFDSNIKEREKGFEIEVAVPGMTKKDLRLQIEENVLYLKGEKVVSSKSWTRKEDFTEFNNTLLQRSFMLPENSNTEGISAKCKNGLLKISIPKKAVNRRFVSVFDQHMTDSNTWMERLKVKRWFKRIRIFFKILHCL